MAASAGHQPDWHLQRHAARHPPPAAQQLGGEHQHVVAGGSRGLPQPQRVRTSKWGLIGLTKTLSIELGDAGIRVNAILPGAVNGPRYQAVLEGRAKQSGRSVAEEAVYAMRNVSIKKLVEPEQIAALAMFLAVGRRDGWKPPHNYIARLGRDGKSAGKPP